MRYITYFIIILFFYNRDNTEYDSFPQAGDGIAYALCTSLINSVSLQSLTHRQYDSTTAAAPEPCTHTLFNNEVRYITYFIIIYFFIIEQGSIPDPAQKKWQALDVFVIFFGAGDGIRTRDFHLGKVAFYHWITPAYYVD